MLPFPVSPYQTQRGEWPQSGKYVLASYDDKTIIVYQAYNDQIADAALKCNNFHSEEVLKAGYLPRRMTWIKTNFLWMMYRSGWATKPNQERILAIQITQEGFNEILRVAKPVGQGDVRLQWDPDHDPQGTKIIDRRAIQLGLTGAIKERFSREFIVKIFDVTPFAREQANYVTCDALMVPQERVFTCAADAASNIKVDQ